MKNFFGFILLMIAGEKLSAVVKSWRVSRLMSRYRRNPMRAVKRNVKCICGSDRKVKVCCGRQRWVPKYWAAKVQGTLDYLTDEQKLKFMR